MKCESGAIEMKSMSGLNQHKKTLTSHINIYFSQTVAQEISAGQVKMAMRNELDKVKSSNNHK